MASFTDKLKQNKVMVGVIAVLAMLVLYLSFTCGSDGFSARKMFAPFPGTYSDSRAEREKAAEEMSDYDYQLARLPNTAGANPVTTNGVESRILDDEGASKLKKEWQSLRPADAELVGENFLNPQQFIGIDTVGSSLRNANYDLRSAPPIPKAVVGPWNQSTIEPDPFRRPLE